MIKRIVLCITAVCLMAAAAFCLPGNAYAAETGTSLPAVYPADGVEGIKKMYPPTRNQKKYGSCWAHAAAACADFDMAKNHGESKDFDVSEIQLAYFTYHTGQDRMRNLNGDKNELGASATHFLSVGGNSIYAMRTLAQWKGFTHEKYIPYDSAKYVIASGLDADYAYRNDAAKLEKGYVADLAGNPDDVKQAIMQYGAAVITYENQETYYNSSTNAYRNPYDNKTNHACVVVGWDDAYPAENFGYPASRDGAWLVRNSKTKKNSASHSGYFWMSYEDRSLGEKAYALDFMPPDRYHHNYQHDGTVSTGNIKAETAANVFTARNLNGAGSETLDAVMISFDDETGVNYETDIYTGLTDRKDPESGYHHDYATTRGTLTHAGIYTVPLKEKVYLAPGETFSVVVKSLDGKRLFDSEKTVNRIYGDGSPRFNGTAHADKGESFYKRNLTDEKWKDCATDGLVRYGNMCIKALTRDSAVQKYTITYVDGGSGTTNPIAYFSTTKDTALQEPVKEGCHFQGWYTDSSFSEPITTISGSLGRNLRLYAKWEAEEIPTPPLAKTVQKKIKKAAAGQVKISWQKTTGATFYQVSKAKKKTGTNVVVKNAKGTACKVKVQKETTYWYKVRACCVVDGKTIKGPWSKPVKYKR